MSYVETMRAVLHGGGKSFVVFSRGTVVILVEPPPERDLAADARELLATWGPVEVGSPAGDFSIITLPDGRGWAVTCHHPDILTLVLPDEAPPEANELSVGLLGRTKRDEDAAALEVEHVEDRRG